MFDGKPLTHESDVLIQGLPAGYTAFASASGSQTDAGTGDNRVGNFRIYDAKGNDVTSHFTNISKVSGKLKVDPAPLSVSSGSASKVYDGTPLTSNESQIIFSAGYEKKTVTQRNLSYVITERTSASVSAASTSSAASGQNSQNGQNGLIRCARSECPERPERTKRTKRTKRPKQPEWTECSESRRPDPVRHLRHCPGARK